MSEENLPPAEGPPTLNHIIGQRSAVEQARIALDAAFQDNQPFPSTLMTGPPGLGKSMLAQVIAREMASGYFEALGQTLVVPADLNALLLSATERSVVFIDEVDESPSYIQTALYKAVEERKLFLEPTGPNRAPQSIPLVPFTIILATNHEHALVQPLRDRLKLLLRFEYYSDSELTEILRQRCRSLGWAADDEVLADIAKRGRGTPRVALRLLESARRVCRSVGETALTSNHLQRVCSLEGVDPRGLDRHELLLQMLDEAKGPAPECHRGKAGIARQEYFVRL